MPRVVPEYKQAARHNILEAAHELFAKNGFRQTTMEDIAEKLGVSKATIYIYFKSKEALFRGIYEASPAALNKILASTFRNEVTLKTAEDFFDRMAKQYAQNPSLSFEIFSEAAHNHTLRESIRRNYEEYVKITSTFLEEKTAGAIGKSFNVRSISLAMIALWNGMETLLVAGLPIPEVRKAWMQAWSAIFSRLGNEPRRGR